MVSGWTGMPLVNRDVWKGAAFLPCCLLLPHRTQHRNAHPYCQDLTGSPPPACRSYRHDLTGYPAESIDLLEQWNLLDSLLHVWGGAMLR